MVVVVKIFRTNENLQLIGASTRPTPEKWENVLFACPPPLFNGLPPEDHRNNVLEGSWNKCNTNKMKHV